MTAVVATSTFKSLAQFIIQQPLFTTDLPSICLPPDISLKKYAALISRIWVNKEPSLQMPLTKLWYCSKHNIDTKPSFSFKTWMMLWMQIKWCHMWFLARYRRKIKNLFSQNIVWHCVILIDLLHEIPAHFK